MLSDGVVSGGALALLTASKTTLAGSPTTLTCSIEELAGKPAKSAGGRRQSSRGQRAKRPRSSIQSMPIEHTVAKIQRRAVSQLSHQPSSE